MSRLRTPRRGGLAGLFALTAIGCLMPTRSAEGQEVGEVFRDCDVCPEMVVVPAGSFIMGSPETEEGRRENEGPQRRVTIGYAFAVGVYEVTFDEWDACVQGGGCGGYEPYDWYGRGKRPVSEVRWEDAWQYADWLTQRTGERVPAVERGGVGVRRAGRDSNGAVLGGWDARAVRVCQRRQQRRLPGQAGEYGASRLVPTEWLRSVRCTGERVGVGG